jgi:hypothetical protein
MKSPHSSNGAETDRASINRENALHSTGPRTEAGKKRSSMNALRHGLTGQTVVLPAEDLAAYRAFTKRFFDNLKPRGVIEEELVQTLADCRWRLNRLSAIENNLLSLGQAEAEGRVITGHPEADHAMAMALAFRHQYQALSSLSTIEQRLKRQFERAAQQLNQLQAERRDREVVQLDHAAKLLQMHQDKKLPYQSAEDGFVFSNDEIETHIRREERLDEAFHAYNVRTYGASS